MARTRSHRKRRNTRRRNQRGGNSDIAAANAMMYTVPPPLVGRVAGWTSDPITWPGVLASETYGTAGADADGITTSNYYALNKNVNPLPKSSGGVYSGCQGGGSKKRKLRKTRSHKKGGKNNKSKRNNKRKSIRRHMMKGGFSPSDLIGNVWYDIQNAVGKVYSNFSGTAAPANPSPLSQPALQSQGDALHLLSKPVNLSTIEQNAQLQVNKAMTTGSLNAQ